MKRKKTGGRKKGTPNRISGDVRQQYRQFIVENFDKFVEAWDSIADPKEKADLYIKASKFVVPSLQSVSLSDSTGRDTTVEEQLRKLSERL